MTFGRQVTGGLGEEEEADSQVSSLVEGLHKDIETAAGRRFDSIQALSVRKQVVAGMNYFVKVSVSHTR